MRSSAYEQRVTASSASSSDGDDVGEQEQTSALPVVPTNVERVTVCVLLYIDDILVIYSVEQLP